MDSDCESPVRAGGDSIDGQPRDGVARLLPDGTLDAAFDPGMLSGIPHYCVLPEADGDILVSGEFFGSVFFERLVHPSPAMQDLELDGDTVTWMRSGSGPALAGPPVLLQSFNGTDFAPLVPMQSIPGGWQVTGFDPPSGQLFWLRALARTRSGYNNGSEGRVAATRQFYVRPVGILVAPVEYDFGDVAPGGNALSPPFVIDSTGDGMFEVGALSVTGPHAAEFILESDQCSGQSLPDGDFCGPGHPSIGIEPRYGGNRAFRIPGEPGAAAGGRSA